MLESTVSASLLVPRELFKVNDTTIYLGCKYYLFKVDTDSLKKVFEMHDSEKNVIRSVVQFNDTTYISIENKSIFKNHEDTAWFDMLVAQRQNVKFGWEMIEYNSELVSSAWPRWISTYNFKNKTWTRSNKLDEQGSGYISSFEKTNTDLYVSMYGGGVFKMDRVSDDWIACNKGLPINLNIRTILSVGNKKIYATTENGIYSSKLKSIKWKPCKQTAIEGIKFVDIK